jgi:DNA-binding MarR family transcriptional regulator
MSDDLQTQDARAQLREQAAQLEAQRVGDSLVKLGRVVFERTVERLRARGFAGVRFSFTALLPHLDRQCGTRITELASRMDISKQATGQMVAQLELLGYVQRRPDPDDGRARLVELTEQGYRVLLAGLDVFGEIESELEQELGVELMSAFRTGAERSLRFLEEMSDA